MKNFYLLFLFLFFLSPKIMAQNPLPNPGFENWTLNGNFYDPDNWNTLNPSTIVLGILTATRANPPDVHSGNLALKLTTKVVFGLTANGIASTGTIITTPPYGVNGGIPYTGRPDSIAGWFKHTPQGTDSGFVQYLSLDANNDTVAFVRWSAPNTNVTTYTRFSKALEYFSSATPVISQWILSSSRGSNPVVNSIIYLDDLELITNASGIAPDGKDPELRVTYSSVNETFYLNNTTGKAVHFSLMDGNGKIILTKAIQEGFSTVNANGLATGLYFYRLLNREGILHKAGKVLIQ